MARIISDNKDVQKALENLAALVAREGGVLSDHLTIECRDGNIRLTSDLPPNSREELVSIPRECFLPLTKVEFRLDGDSLVIVSGTEGLTKPQQEMLKTMIDLYNLTDKITKYKISSPRIVFRKDEDLVKLLVSGRAGTNVANMFLDVMGAENIDDLVIDYFFRTRNFNLEEEARQIIPFIDFANHYTATTPFVKDRQGGRLTRMVLKNSKPLAGSDECFARYGLWDPFDTYLMFGFATDPGVFVRSVPMELNIPDIGILRIRSAITSLGDVNALDPRNRDLRRFYPTTVTLEGHNMTISSLTIPDAGSPMALKRVLNILISKMAPEIDPQQIRQRVILLEQNILQVNHAFFTRLGEYLEQVAPKYPNCPALDEARKMVRIQLQTLAEYQAAQNPQH